MPETKVKITNQLGEFDADVTLKTSRTSTQPGLHRPDTCRQFSAPHPGFEAFDTIRVYARPNSVGGKDQQRKAPG